MKFNILVMAIVCFFAGACDGYVNVAKVCVKYRTIDQYCGSGFFIAPDVLVTAKHITDKTKDNILWAIRNGTDETSSDWNFDLGYDTNVVTFDSDLTEDLCPVCPNVVIGAEVDMVGVIGAGEGDRVEKEGVIVSIQDGWLVIEGEAKHGMSGGPVVDIERGCVVGVISGLSSSSPGFTVASVITLDRIEEVGF